MALLLICIWSYFALLTFVNPFEAIGIPRHVWPAAMLSLALLAFVNPLPIMYKRSRYWFMITIVRAFFLLFESEWKIEAFHRAVL